MPLDLGSYFQYHLINSSKPYVRVSYSCSANVVPPRELQRSVGTYFPVVHATSLENRYVKITFNQCIKTPGKALGHCLVKL